MDMNSRQYYEQENALYVNPTKSEIYKASKAAGPGSGDIRFIADSRNKKFFVWNAEVEIHPHVAPMLVKAREIKPVTKYPSAWQSPYFLMGIAKVEKNGKLKLTNCDNWEWNESSSWIKEAVFKDWTWIKGYFSDMSLLDYYRKKMKDDGNS